MALGKGLEALIPKKGKKTGAESPALPEQSRGGVFSLELSKIDVPDTQPRKDFSNTSLADLAASIRQHGILQPLIVEKREEESRGRVEVRYVLLAGERRLRAAKLAGLRQVPVVIRPSSDDRTRLLLSLIENVQREDLNAIDRAEAYARLRDEFQLSQEEIGERVGKSRESVANTLRLLQFDDATRKAIRKGEISEGHARALLAVPDEERKNILAQLKERPMTVRETEALARSFSLSRIGEVSGGRPPVRVADPRRARDEEVLKKKLGVPVRITARGEHGSIAISFRSKAEFAQLLKRLLK